jgi:hypothetical protein
MSNHNNKPRLGMPGSAPPPPPIPPPPAAATIALPPDFAALIERFPLPWVVGPHGDVWVAADVEPFDPTKEAGPEKVPGPNGTFWRSTCARPRLVIENPADAGIAAFMVFAVNKLGRA